MVKRILVALLFMLQLRVSCDERKALKAFLAFNGRNVIRWLPEIFSSAEKLFFRSIKRNPGLVITQMRSWLGPKIRERKKLNRNLITNIFKLRRKKAESGRRKPIVRSWLINSGSKCISIGFTNLFWEWNFELASRRKMCFNHASKSFSTQHRINLVRETFLAAPRER